MTMLEKFREGFPKANTENFIFWCCPHDFGLESDEKEPCGGWESNNEEQCRKCWNREVRE